METAWVMSQCLRTFRQVCVMESILMERGLWAESTFSVKWRLCQHWQCVSLETGDFPQHFFLVCGLFEENSMIKELVLSILSTLQRTETSRVPVCWARWCFLDNTKVGFFWKVLEGKSSRLGTGSPVGMLCDCRWVPSPLWTSLWCRERTGLCGIQNPPGVTKREMVWFRSCPHHEGMHRSHWGERHRAARGESPSLLSPRWAPGTWASGFPALGHEVSEH